MKRGRQILPLFLLLLSCASEYQDEGFRAIFAPLVSDGCQSTGAGDLNFPEGVSSVVVRILKSDGGELFRGRFGKESLSKSGEILIAGITPGSGYTIEVFGCSGDEPTWSGMSVNVTVSKHMKSSPPIYLTKIGDFSCTGFSGKIGGSLVGSQDMSDMRAFHAAADLGDGKIYISGGLRDFKVGNPSTALAGESIDFYSPDFSVFFKSGNMIEKRAFHAMYPIAGSKLLIAGGIKNVEFNITEHGLPIMPHGKKTDYIPVPFEIFDTETVRSQALLHDAEIPPFAALLFIPQRNLLLVSGGLTDDKTTDALTVYEATGEEITVKENLVMAHPRVGHSMIRLSDDEIALFGGSTKTPVEVISLETGKSVPVEIKGDTEALPFVFFSLIPLKGSGEYLFSGGNWIKADNPLKVQKLVTSANLYRLKLTEENGGAKYSVEISALTSDMEELFKRSYGASFSEGDSLVLSNGYRSFAKVSGIDECEGRPDCLLRSLISFHIDNNSVVVDAAKYMSHPRFGSRIILLGNGTVLISGGFEALNKDDAILPTAEIYNTGNRVPAGICQ